jgi:hypothetical protein
VTASRAENGSSSRSTRALRISFTGSAARAAAHPSRTTAATAANPRLDDHPSPLPRRLENIIFTSMSYAGGAPELHFPSTAPFRTIIIP